MAASAVRRWLHGLQARPGTIEKPKKKSRARLALERLEGREVPSSNIPLNGVAWTELGPRPILQGETPGRLTATGRFDSVAAPIAAPGNPLPPTNNLYAASAVGGIWTSSNNGASWAPRTDKLTVDNPINGATFIRAVQRSADATQDTVYAASFAAGGGFFYFSTNSGATFTQLGAAAFGGRQINEFIVIPGATQAEDLIFAAVQSVGDPATQPAGIYRSTDGGQNWTNITATGFPFPQVNNLTFSDVDVDPTNLNVVYATVNGDPTQQNAVGVYRCTNALSAGPFQWTLRLGGASAFPGTFPGRLQTSISPVLPSTIFVSVSAGNIYGVYRSTDTGINWTPLLSTTFLPAPNGIVPDYGQASGAGLGNTYSRILVDPNSPLDPTRQIVYAAGAGDLATDTPVIVSRDSGNTWTNISVNPTTGAGPYFGVRDLVLDRQGRITVATEGGIYRINGFTAQNDPIWVSVNGTATSGLGSLGTVQVSPFGQSINPFDRDQIIINQGPWHAASRFNDTGPNSFGWQTLDSRTEPWFQINPVPLPHLSEQSSFGNVYYDFNNPNTIIRVANGGVRISRDGGATWDFANAPFPYTNIFGNPAFGAFVPNPSDSRRFFSTQAQDDVYLYESTSDAFATIEDFTGFRLPSLDFFGAPGSVTAIGVSRQSNLLYVATTPGIYESDIQTQADPPPPPPPLPTTKLFVLRLSGGGIPNAMGIPQFDWIELSLPLEVAGSPTNPMIQPDIIDKIIVDPNNPLNVYFTSQGGQGIYNMRSPVIDWAPPPDPPPPPVTIQGPDPRAAVATVVWQRINPTGGTNQPPPTINPASVGVNVMTLDPNIATNPNDDILYIGTNYGVFSLLVNPTQTNNFVWQRVGGDELPNNPVRDLDINTSTGVLSVGLDGRGVWQFQIRTLVRGQVYNDRDGDGLVPPIGTELGELPLTGFVVTLRDTATNSVVATTTTDAEGAYEFISVPAGTYTVQVVPPAGWLTTTSPVPNFTVTLRDAVLGVVPDPNNVPPGTQHIPALNVGLYRVGSISGIKFDDANQNSVRDAGEVGLPGFTIYIDANNNSQLDAGEVSAITDSTGAYTFTNLGPAVLNGLPNPTFQGNPGAAVPTYTLRELAVPGWQQTLPDPNVNGGAATVQVISGANPAGINFGNFQAGSIRGKAFFDINANGLLEAGEQGLAGRRVFFDLNGNDLFDAGEPSVLTDADGFYAFTNLTPGKYVVRQQAVTGFVQTTPNPGVITLTGTNSVTGVLFGSFRPSTNRWDPIGPAPQLGGQGIGNPNVSGRVNDIAVAKSPGGGPDRYFIATDGGGVWRSLDAGVNWRPLTDNLPNLSVNQATSNFSSIAVAPANVNVVYAGGAQGVLRSTDGGDTWQLSQGPGNAFAGSTISRIEVDRTNPNIVIAAVTGFLSSGIFVSTDGGSSWSNTTQFDPLFNGGEQWTDVQVDPNNPNVVFAAVGNFGGSTGNGIYRTTNALSPLPTWTLMIGGSAFLPGSLPGQIKLAMAPSQPSTIYAALARAIDPFTGDSLYLGTYKTTDGGVNWVRLINAPDFMGTQGDYNVAIEVAPTNPNVVYAGGLGVGPEFSVNLVISTNDGGANWRSAVIGGGADANLGPHVDIHGMAFDSSNRLLVGSDGGMFRLNNALLPAPNFAPPFGGVVPNWVQLNGGVGNPNSLNTVQFVGIATHPRDAKRAAGGSQDNGVAQYQGNPAWLTRLGGDGGEVIWDFDQPNNLYRIAPIASVGANNYIAKSVDGGVSWADATNGITGQTQQNTLFYPPIIIDPGNSQRLFTGTDVVWATDNGGIEWKNETKFSPAVDTPIPTTPFSGQNPPVPITTLAVGRSASQFLYISQGGRMLRIFLRAPFPNPPTTEDWIDVTPPGALDITDILIDPTNPNTVYAVAPSFGGQVWRSTNQGGTWTLLDGSGVGRLPGLGIGAIALDTRGSTNPSDDILYIGNTNGVWQTTNPTSATPIWERTGGATLPVVSVTDLDLNATTGLLSAGTYGRGMWNTRIRGQISGRVFTDTNGNGVFDVGEVGRAGVTVRLLDATPGGSFGAELATTVTDAQGFYAFSSLRAGNYMVEQALPGNGVQTTAKSPAFIDVTETTDIRPSFDGGGPPPAGVIVEPLLDMGFFQLGTIGGVKFDDVNQNSTRDAGEFALPGFTIYVDRNNNGIFDADERFVDLNGNNIQDPGEPNTFAVTDANGFYTLTSIFPAVVLGQPGPMPIPYRIREVQQPGFIQTTSNPNITPTSGLALTNVNFGNFRPGSIRGQVFFDLNNDAVLQPGEPGQANWQVYIDVNRNDVFDVGEPTVLTDAAGFFSFSNLPPGTYRIRQVLQPGFGQTTPNPADATLNGSNSVSGILFGLFQVFNPWIEIGPRPILNGQSPGQPTATGRFDEVAITPSQTPGGPDVYYAASQDGGIWRSTNAGQSWNVRSDVLPFTSTTAIAAFSRQGGDTVYAATQTGVYKSVDGANTFNLLGSAFLGGGTVSAMAAVRSAVTPNNPNTDILFVTVPGVGIFRSTDGAQTWTDISTGFPVNPRGLLYTDVDIEPGNPNVVYVSVGSPAGGPTNGVYRVDNALTAGPVVPGVWTLRIGGSQFLPGATPGRIELTISPSAPSVLFASVAERAAPLSGISRLLGVFRSTDSGINWTGLYNPEVIPSGNVPNYMNLRGNFNNTIIVSPFSGTDPTRQILFAGGYGDTPNNVVFSLDSGNTWQDISQGANGVGPYVGVHGMTFDAVGRLIVSTQGGIFRLNGIFPSINWQPLNGNPGLGALNSLAIPIGGYASHPTDPYQGFANGGIDHSAVQHNGRLPAGYGWRTLDAPTTAPFFTNDLGRDGSGKVFYNFDNPNTLFRVTTSNGANDTLWLRRSTDGGATWQGIANGIPGQFGNRYIYEVEIDPGNSEHIFVGTDQVGISNDGGNTWGVTIQTSVTSSTPIPTLPTSGQSPPIPITAIGVGRTSGTVRPRLYAATAAGDLRTVSMPDAAPPAQPATTEDWIAMNQPGGTVVKILVDPTNDLNIYVLTAGGLVLNGLFNPLTGQTLWTQLNDPNNGVSPDELGSPGANSIVLDPRSATDPTDDALYLGTNSGVYKLVSPGGLFNQGPFFWSKVGTGLPNLPVTSLDLNTTTGLLSAATDGRGVWQVQIRALIQGVKYDDTNGNGIREAGEPPVPGVVIQIVDVATGGVIATTTTDAQGIYEFRSLRAGQYIVREVTPAGTVLVSEAVPVLTLNETDAAVSTYTGPLPVPTSITVVPQLALGNYRLATISGFKFEDRDADGVRDAGEPGIGGFIIYFDRNLNGVRDWTDTNGNGVWDPGEGERWTVTAADGSYAFTGLLPRDYPVREIQQLGFSQTSPNPPTIRPNSGQTVSNVNFGNIRIARLEGALFNDVNGNGIREGNEPGLGGFTLQLVDRTTGLVVRSVLSDPDGSYAFRSLVPGNYEVRQALPAGWIQTFPVLNGQPLTYQRVVGPTDQIGGLDFGNFRLFNISGVKFEDLNGNGARDAGEPGAAGFTFTVRNLTTGATASAVSGPTGAYTIPNLGPGSYSITEVPRAGWVQTTPNPPDFQALSGADLPNVDFGNFKLITVTGTVFGDVNQNGVRDAGEPLLAGFTVLLDRNNDGTVEAQAVSDASGVYTFNLVGPGVYSLRQQPRRGWRLTSPSSGAYVFQAVSSQTVTGRDFGNINQGIYALGADSGGGPTVSIRSLQNNQQVASFLAYTPAFRGGVRVATGFFDGTPNAQVVTAAGPGGGPHVRVFNPLTGQEIYGFFAYTGGFSGGVYVATGDVNGDGFDDIITGPGPGGGPHVRVWSGQTRQELFGFFAYGANFPGGVRVAAGDVDGDGKADIITAAGPGGGPHVRVFSGATGQPIREFFAYAPNFSGGVFVSAGDFNGDGKADIVTSPGAGGGPHVRVFSGVNLGEIASVFPYESNFLGGVHVHALDVTFDNRADLIVGPGPGRQPQVRTLQLSGSGFSTLNTFLGFDPSFLGGVWVG